jgi:hypothetical protein
MFNILLLSIEPLQNMIKRTRFGSKNLIILQASVAVDAYLIEGQFLYQEQTLNKEKPPIY